MVAVLIVFSWRCSPLIIQGADMGLFCKKNDSGPVGVPLSDIAPNQQHYLLEVVIETIFVIDFVLNPLEGLPSLVIYRTNCIAHLHC